jgi:SAM-dependent methyltransferase
LEFVRTREIILRHLPQRQLRILDVGGGTGVHARWLAEAGHEVVVVDIVPRHVEAANELGALGLSVTAQLGDARRLAHTDGSFDVVLLLGPLYHFPLPQPYDADTILVGPGERYTVIVHADNLGTWAWHCHILSHAESDKGMFGMVTAMVVQPA